MSSYVSYGLAFVTTIALLRLLHPLAIKIELLDRPGLRKTHLGSVPLIGGLAMFCGFALAALTLDIGLTPYRSFFAASAILVVVGIFDDFRELSSPARFAAQIGASLLMIYWGRTVLVDLGLIGWSGGLAALGVWAVPMTVFSTVGVINALNMADGLDGLAGGLVLVPVLGMLYVAAGSGEVASARLLLLLGLVVGAFLLFNVRFPGRRRARVFMGDSGSMFLGFALTWFFVALSQGDNRVMAPVTALWLLAVPLFDAVWLIVHRLLRRRSPFDSDAEHLHHLLRMAGFSVNQTVGIICGVAVTGALVGLAAEELQVAESAMFYAFLGLFGVYCLGIGYSWHTGRFLGRRLDRRLVPVDRRQTGERRQAERRRRRDRRFGEDRRDGAPEVDPELEAEKYRAR